MSVEYWYNYTFWCMYIGIFHISGHFQHLFVEVLLHTVAIFRQKTPESDWNGRLYLKWAHYYHKHALPEPSVDSPSNPYLGTWSKFWNMPFRNLAKLRYKGEAERVYCSLDTIFHPCDVQAVKSPKSRRRLDCLLCNVQQVDEGWFNMPIQRSQDEKDIHFAITWWSVCVLNANAFLEQWHKA